MAMAVLYFWITSSLIPLFASLLKWSLQQVGKLISYIIYIIAIITSFIFHNLQLKAQNVSIQLLCFYIKFLKNYWKGWWFQALSL